MLQIAIPKVKIEYTSIYIASTSELVCGRRPDARVSAKGDADLVFEECLYKIPGGFGFPASAFKSAIVEGAKKAARVTAQSVFVIGPHRVSPYDLVELLEARPGMRVETEEEKEHVRAVIPKWLTELRIAYNPRTVTLEHLQDLVDHAGSKVGIGLHRPARKGKCGTWTTSA